MNVSDYYDENGAQHNYTTTQSINRRQWPALKSEFSQCNQYLVACANIVVIAIDVHALGNVRRLLLDSNQQIQRTPIEAWEDNKTDQFTAQVGANA